MEPWILTADFNFNIKCSLDTYLASLHSQQHVLVGAHYRLCPALGDVGDAEVEIRTTSVLNMTLYPAPGIGSGTEEAIKILLNDQIEALRNLTHEKLYRMTS